MCFCKKIPDPKGILFHYALVILPSNLKYKIMKKILLLTLLAITSHVSFHLNADENEPVSMQIPMQKTDNIKHVPQLYILRKDLELGLSITSDEIILEISPTLLQQMEL